MTAVPDPFPSSRATDVDPSADQPRRARELAYASTSPPISFEVVSLRSVYRASPARGDALLEAYYPGYAAAFPDQNERRSQAGCRDLVTRENATQDDITILRKGGTIVGGAHHCLITGEKARLALLGYLWVGNEFRRYGVGSTLDELVLAYAKNQGCLGVLTPMNDPSRMSAQAKETDAACGVTPESRLEFWRARGRFAFDAPYLLPPLHVDGEMVPHLMMTAAFFEPPPNGFPKDEYLALLRGIFERFTDPLLEPAYRETEKRLAEREWINLIPLGEKRTLA